MVYLQPGQGNTKRSACGKERYLISLLFKYINYVCFTVSLHIQDHFKIYDICSSIYMLPIEPCACVCFPDIASRMSAHHLKSKLYSCFLLVCPQQDPSITADKTMVTATQNSKILVALWTPDTATVWYYQYHIGPFPTRDCVQLHVQV